MEEKNTYFFNYHIINHVLSANGVNGWTGEWFGVKDGGFLNKNKNIDEFMSLTGGKFVIFANCLTLFDDEDGKRILKSANIPLVVKVDNFSLVVSPCKHLAFLGRSKGNFSHDFQEEIKNWNGNQYREVLLNKFLDLKKELESIPSGVLLGGKIDEQISYLKDEIEDNSDYSVFGKQPKQKNIEWFV